MGEWFIKLIKFTSQGRPSNEYPVSNFLPDAYRLTGVIVMQERQAARGPKQDVVSRVCVTPSNLSCIKNVDRYQFTFLLRAVQEKHWPIGSLACRYRVQCSSEACSSFRQQPAKIEKGRRKERQPQATTAAVAASYC